MRALETTLSMNFHRLRKQQGAVLIVALVVLLVLTILGIAGVQNTTMEERMAGNYRDRYSAFQAAESALRAGEEEIAVFTTFSAMLFNGNASTGSADGTYEVQKTTGSVNPLTLDWDQYSRDVSVVTLSGVAAVPQFVVERLPKVPLPKSSLVLGYQSKPKDVQYFRVSGRGIGVSGRAEVVLQSTYHR